MQRASKLTKSGSSITLLMVASNTSDWQAALLDIWRAMLRHCSPAMRGRCPGQKEIRCQRVFAPVRPLLRLRLHRQLEVHEGERHRREAEEHLVEDRLPDDEVDAHEDGAVEQKEHE